MVGAAYRLFCEKGYVATTMEAIAREADVAVPTLYFTFRTKGAILGEALGAAVMGFDEPVGPEDTSWYAEFQAEPNARRALRILVENTTPILGRVGPLMAATYAAASDPEVTSVYELGEKRRVEGYRAIVQMLARKGGLRPGIRVARATDILLVLLGPQLFDALANGRGWTGAECNRWIVEVLSQQLLTPSEHVSPAGRHVDVSKSRRRPSSPH